MSNKINIKLSYDKMSLSVDYKDVTIVLTKKKNTIHLHVFILEEVKVYDWYMENCNFFEAITSQKNNEIEHALEYIYNDYLIISEKRFF